MRLLRLPLVTPTIVGNGAGGMNALDKSFHKLYGENAAPVHPLSIPRWMMNAACSHVSMGFGTPTGPTILANARAV